MVRRCHILWQTWEQQRRTFSGSLLYCFVPSEILAPLLSFLSAYVRREVGEAVGEALGRELPLALRAAALPTYMSREDAAAYLGRSVRSLDGLRESGQIPWTKRGGRILLRTDDLDAYLDAGRVPVKHPRRGEGA